MRPFKFNVTKFFSFLSFLNKNLFWSSSFNLFIELILITFLYMLAPICLMRVTFCFLIEKIHGHFLLMLSNMVKKCKLGVICPFSLESFSIIFELISYLFFDSFFHESCSLRMMEPFNIKLFNHSIKMINI